MQLTFDDIRLVPRRSRRTDPVTSKSAAERAEKFAETHRARVLSVLRNRDAGPTEIGEAIGMEPYAVRKRLADAQHLGEAEPTDRTAMTASGGTERVWRVL